jgi:hypothetical protein
MAHRENLTKFAGALESLKLIPVTTDLAVALQDLTLASFDRCPRFSISYISATSSCDLA